MVEQLACQESHQATLPSAIIGDRVPITDADLASLKTLGRLKDLRQMNFHYTEVTDAGLKELNKLKGLKVLDLTYTNATEAGVNRLRQALPQTVIRWISRSASPVPFRDARR